MRLMTRKNCFDKLCVLNYYILYMFHVKHWDYHEIKIQDNVSRETYSLKILC